jgi:hypothetical protein
LSAGTTAELEKEDTKRGPCSFGVCQNYPLPEQVVSLVGAERRYLSPKGAGWRLRDTNCRPMAHLPKNAPPGANRRQAATPRDEQRQKTAERDRGRQETPIGAFFVDTVATGVRAPRSRQLFGFEQLFGGQNR